MCGFCGFTGDIKDRENVIIGMMDRIVHRGPDSAGIHSDKNVTLGFRRLSIIDLDNGSQPMYNRDKSIVIVFNGEIYNYQQLREDLIQKGYEFKTHSDTETLLHLYEDKGEAMLDHLRGMFAFVVYDIKKNSLFAARDFFGIKPFYYGKFGGSLVFGSEIKSFLEFPKFKKQVNEVALENYLTFQYSVLEETFFKGVFKLMPGHCMTYKDGKVKIRRYFQPKFEPEEAGLQDSIKKVEDVLKDSIEAHKVSDVEVGSFLSSGVDSSFVAATFNGDRTFTVGFDYEKYNEIGYAEALSEKVGIENYSKIISTEEYWNNLSKVQYHMDEPLADPSAIALYFVSRLAAKHVKVALSGEGADEFFGGYNIYKEPMDLGIMTAIPMPLRKLAANICRALPFKIKGMNYIIRSSMTLEERFIGNAKMFSEKERANILKNPTGKYHHMEITKPYYDFTKGLDPVT
ncbi:MAG: asparagine synthase (glutamine-hydrolyzing), partial [Firmicutes bacterium]|nr:asparagine synthase (glutamine-hydrolyzing) [Bacillota bacterium]